MHRRNVLKLLSLLGLSGTVLAASARVRRVGFLWQGRIARAERHRLPAIHGRPEYVADGGLMAFGISLPEVQARVASIIHRTLDAPDPATLPMEQPTRFELLVNLGAARRLGLTMPPAILARADAIVE